jgi:membrane-associated phospholipid phosphatase
MRRRCSAFWVAAGFFAIATCAAPSGALAEETPRVEWQPHWLKVQPYEYVTAGVLSLAALGIQLFVDSRTHGPYGGVLFDDALRDWLGADSRSGRSTARHISDWGYRIMIAFPYFDVILTWAIHGNSEVAWQMLAMDFEAQAVAGVIGLVTNHFIGRARPSVEPCAQDPTYEDFCYRGSYSSFMSGHSVMAAVGAGVTCAHHLSMPLYGGGAGDILACAASSTLAFATGIGRIVNDRHWASDVVTAWIVGAAVGYLWPRFVHYRDRDETGVSYLLLPSFTPGPNEASLQMLGMF